MKKKTPEELLLELTEREIDVLLLVCQHKNYQEIAKVFVLTQGTIRTHMFNIYAKLELDHLDRDEKVLKIHNIYCPLLQKQSEQQQAEPEIEMIDEAPDPDSASPDEEKVAREAPEPEPISQEEEEVSEEIPDPDSASPYEEQVAEVTPDPEPISQEEEEVTEETTNPDPISPEDEKMIDEDEKALVTYRSERKTGGRKKMKTEKERERTRFIITLILGALIVMGVWYVWQNFFMDVPIVQSIVPKSISNAGAYEVGEWHKEDDLWIRLRDYELTNYDYDRMVLYMEIWNKSDQEIYFSWDTETNLELKDNRGTRYDLTNRYIPGSDNESLLPEERSDLLPGLAKGTAEYFVSPMFENGVTELLFSVDYLSRFEKATWRIPVNK